MKFPEQAGDAARENFVAAVTKEEHVKYAESNVTHQALATPNDPQFGDQYAPQQVDAPGAWDTTFGDASVTIGVVDIGLSENQQSDGQVDAEAAVGTEPGRGGDDDSGDGGSGDSSSVSGSLDGSVNYDDYSYGWNYDSPSQVVIELDGPSDADFDLSVNTGPTENATPSDYASYTTDSQESTTIDSPDDSTAMQIDVDSYSGSGSYTLRVTEDG
ncbi:MAG: hypothetical protein ACOCQL_04170 [Halolamina sp.]